MEFVGPSGRIGNEHEFIINGGQNDLFVLREKENNPTVSAVTEKF